MEAPQTVMRRYWMTSSLSMEFPLGIAQISFQIRIDPCPDKKMMILKRVIVISSLLIFLERVW